MKFKAIWASILAFLTIEAFSKGDDGKMFLTDDQKAKLTEAFGETFTTKFAASLTEDEPPDTSGESDNTELVAQLQTNITNLETKIKGIETELETATTDKTDLQAQIDGFNTTILEQKNIITALGKNPEDDPEGSGADGKNTDIAMNDKFLFGQSTMPMMAIDGKRPYNQRAYSALMERRGMIVPVVAAASVDYSSLSADLGDFYKIRKQDRIQSFLLELPSIEKIFPLESGYQDRAVLVNMFLEGDFSQADQFGATFDNLVVGNYKFEPEELRMYDVLFAHKFTNLKELEKQWIGYLNKEGSDVMKWSFIEFIMIETAKKLHNEREQRRVRGVRVNPTLNTPGTAMQAANGFLKFLKTKIAAFQIKEFLLGEWTPSNIVDYVFNGTMMIPAVLRDSGTMQCHMSVDAKIYYDKNFDTLFGANSDYSGPVDKVKFIKSIPVVAVPNMGESKRVWWTFNGNIHTFEHKPGEMIKFNFEQQDWTLKVWSNWKESIWAYMVGKKFASAAAQDYDHQMIFCNDVDEPADFYVPMTADDVTPSVAEHTSLVSVANSQATALTDIDDAIVGKEIRLKCGNATNAITIAKAGDFSVISAAWNPGVGDIIILKKRSDGKFIEIDRQDATSQAIVIPADDTTPDVAAGDTFVTSANTVATAITQLDNSSYDVVYTIYGGSDADSSTIANAGNFVLTGAMTLSDGTYIKLQKSKVDDKYYEISRG